MKLLLSPHAKTVPSNYTLQPVDYTSEAPPGATCDKAAWDKALRQESEYYDWEGYIDCQLPKMEHPEYIKRAEEAALVKTWEEIISKLEPMRN